MNGYLAELIGGLVLAVMGALAGIAAFLAWPLLAKLAMPLLLHLAAPRQAQGLLSILTLFAFGLAVAFATSVACKLLRLPLDQYRPPSLPVFVAIAIPVFGATIGLMYLLGGYVSSALRPFFGSSADAATTIAFGIALIAVLRTTHGLLQRRFGL